MKRSPPEILIPIISKIFITNQKLQIMKRLYLFFSLCLIMANTSVSAQNKSLFENKYSASVDALGFFKNGHPDKVIFKINKIKDNEIKGAYRIGIGAGYNLRKIEGTHDGDNYELWDKEQIARYSILLGYEKHYYIKNVNLYYGADLENYLVLTNVLPENPGDSEFFRFGIIPFVGINLPISKHFSTSIEVGIHNMLIIDKHNSSDQSPDDITKTTHFITQINSPYTLSLNYKF